MPEEQAKPRRVQIIYDYSDVPTIRRFALSNARHRVLIGPFGSGKSTGCVMEIIRRAHLQAPSPIDGLRRTRWAVIRNSYGQLRDTTMKTVFDWFPPGIYGTQRVADHEFIITGFPGVRIEIMFRALDRPDQVDNLLSLELTGAWINEAREVPRAIWEALDGRIFRYPSRRNGGVTWGGIIQDTNPPDEDNWLYKLVEKEKPKNLEFFRQPGGRSPYAENLINLPQGYYENLAIGKTDEFILVYIDGEYGFVTEGQAVYKYSWNDSLHTSKVILEPFRNLNLITGWDFALYPVCIITQLTQRGQWRILDEIIGESMGIERFIDTLVLPLLQTKYRGMGVWGQGDPAGNTRSQTNEQTCYDVLRKNGFYWIKPSRTNAIIARTGAVEHFLTKLVDGQPATILSPNCVTLRKGFNGGYQLKDGIPLKNGYCVDFDTEILTVKGWKKREELVVLDQVYGYDMTDKTLKKTTVRGIFEQLDPTKAIKFSNHQSEFIYTHEHRCLASRRMTKIGEDRYTDYSFILAKELNFGHSLMTPHPHLDERVLKKAFVYSDWFVRLCAWVFTEGTYRKKDGTIVICQSAKHNPEYVGAIDDLLLWHPCLISRGIVKNGELMTWKIGRELATQIKQVMPEKYPTETFIVGMRNSQKRLFLYEANRGDGTYGRGEYGPMPTKQHIGRNRDFWLDRHITLIFTAKEKAHVDAMQMLATLVGIETRIRTKRQKIGQCYDLYFIKDHKRLPISNFTREEVEVPVWCPQTDLGTWVSRRNGVVCITGNSHPHDGLQAAALFIADKSRQAGRSPSATRAATRQFVPATSAGY